MVLGAKKNKYYFGPRRNKCIDECGLPFVHLLEDAKLILKGDIDFRVFKKFYSEETMQNFMRELLYLEETQELH